MKVKIVFPPSRKDDHIGKILVLDRMDAQPFTYFLVLSKRYLSLLVWMHMT